MDRTAGQEQPLNLYAGKSHAQNAECWGVEWAFLKSLVVLYIFTEVFAVCSTEQAMSYELSTAFSSEF